jgi:hypothetical protein
MLTSSAWKSSEQDVMKLPRCRVSIARGDEYSPKSRQEMILSRLMRGNGPPTYAALMWFVSHKEDIVSDSGHALGEDGDWR